MNRERAILLGLAIGDGCLYSNRGHCGITIKHSIKQKAYLEYKCELLHSVIGGSKPKIHEIDNNGYPGVYFSKGNNKAFRLLRKTLYQNNEKMISRVILDRLNDLSIALWYMDDGNLSMKKRNGKIHARELFLNTHIEKDKNQIIIDYFLEKYNVKFTQVKNRGSYRLRCGTTEAMKFIEIVKPYIIESMHYKIDMKY